MRSFWHVCRRLDAVSGSLRRHVCGMPNERLAGACSFHPTNHKAVYFAPLTILLAFCHRCDSTFISIIHLVGGTLLRSKIIWTFSLSILLFTPQGQLQAVLSMCVWNKTLGGAVGRWVWCYCSKYLQLLHLQNSKRKKRKHFTHVYVFIIPLAHLG